MNRLCLFLLLFLSINLTFGQATEPILDFNYIYNKLHKLQTEKAKTNKFKTVTTYEYKNEKLKNGKLKSIYSYDENGLLTYALDHRFIKYKDFSRWDYTYDSLQRISKIIMTSSFGKDYSYYSFKYTVDSNIEYYIWGYGEGKSEPDTTFYFYYEDGRTKYELSSVCNTYHYDPHIKYPGAHRDTTYYHYDEYGDARKNYAKIDTVNYKIRDENGCVVGYEYDEDDDITTMICDSLCNVLSYKEQMQRRGKRITISSGESKFIGKTCIETKRYSCPNTLLHNCIGILTLWYHEKYEYNDKGFLIKETSYNSVGGIKEIRQTVYETY